MYIDLNVFTVKSIEIQKTIINSTNHRVTKLIITTDDDQELEICLYSQIDTPIDIIT